MNFINKDKFKYKLLSFNEMIINLDRLTRFKLPEESFSRVFYSILSRNLIYPKYSKSQLAKLPPKLVSDYVKMIWNASVKNIFAKSENNIAVNRAIKLLIKKQFKNLDESTKIFVNTNLILSSVVKNLNYNSSPANLRFLIKVNELFSSNDSFTYKELIEIRKKFLLKFPIQKVLIVEGITEENLLPVFASKLGYNFDAEGVYVLGAGGKSKSPDLYVKLKDKLNLPIIILFDSDAKEICELLKQSLSKYDKTIIIEKGEFEDILSVNLLKRAINKEYENSNMLLKSDLQIYDSMCQNIEHFYKTRKLGEFKKSKLSKIVAANVKYDSDITVEIKKIINEIADF